MPGKTYQQYLQEQRNQQNINEALVGNMIAATVMMQGEGADAEVKMDQVVKLSRKLRNEPAFEQLMKEKTCRRW